MDKGSVADFTRSAWTMFGVVAFDWTGVELRIASTRIYVMARVGDEHIVKLVLLVVGLFWF